MELSAEELHILVSWGYAIRGLDGDRFSKEEADLLERLKEHRRREIIDQAGDDG